MTSFDDSKQEIAIIFFLNQIRNILASLQEISTSLHFWYSLIIACLVQHCNYSSGLSMEWLQSKPSNSTG